MPIIGFPLSVVIQLFHWILTQLSDDNFEDVSAALIEMRRDIVCILWNLDSAAQATIALEAWLETMSTEPTANAWILGIFNQNTLNGIYGGTIEVPEAYNGSVNCELECGLPDDYILIKPILAEVEFTDNPGLATLTYDDVNNVWYHQAYGATTWHSEYAEVDVQAMKTRLGVGNVVAGICRFIGGDAVTNDPELSFFPTTNGPQVNFDLEDVPYSQINYDNTEYNAVEAFEDYVNSYARKLNYGNGEPDGNFVTLTYGANVEESMLFEVWFVSRKTP
jgi:hypothetical protein